MFNRLFWGCALSLVLTGAAANPGLVLLERHAETTSSEGDRNLSPAGELRTQSLAEAARFSMIDAVVATQFRRTLETANPVMDQQGLDLTIVTKLESAAESDVNANAEAVIDALQQFSNDDIVLVLGYSHTIPIFSRMLGNPSMPESCEDDFDTLFALDLSASEPLGSLISARYGAEDDAPSDCEGR